MREPDDRDEQHECERRERCRQRGGGSRGVARGECWQRLAEEVEPHPDDSQDHRTCPHRVDDQRSAARDVAVRERRGGDQPPADRAADDARPVLDGSSVESADRGNDREHEQRERGGEEAREQEDVEAATFDGEAGCAQHRDEPAGQHEHGLQRELQLGRVVRRLQIGIGRGRAPARRRRARTGPPAPRAGL